MYHRLCKLGIFKTYNLPQTSLKCQRDSNTTKGQLILKCPFGVFKSLKKLINLKRGQIK